MSDVITMSDEKEEKKKQEPVPWGTSDPKMYRKLCDAQENRGGED